MKSPNLVEPNIVIEDDNVEEEEDKQDISIKSPDHIHLLPIEKARRRVRLKNSQSDDYSFGPVLGEGSVYTSPSLFSLISIPDKTSKNEVYSELIAVSSVIRILHHRMYLMLYQRKRELMELFLTKLIIYTYGKEPVHSWFYFLLLCSFSLK